MKRTYYVLTRPVLGNSDQSRYWVGQWHYAPAVAAAKRFSTVSEALAELKRIGECDVTAIVRVDEEIVESVIETVLA